VRLLEVNAIEFVLGGGDGLDGRVTNIGGSHETLLDGKPTGRAYGAKKGGK
jgi:hypothetical protein